MHRKRHGGSGIDLGYFFDRKGKAQIVGAAAAELLGDDDPQQAGFRQLGVQLARKDVLAIPFRDIRRNLSLRDLLGQLTDRDLIGGQLELRCPRGERGYAASFLPPS